MADCPLNECRIEVGRVVIGLVCESEEYAASMREYFRSGDSARAPDVRLRLEIVEHDGPRTAPDSLFNTKKLTDSGFDINNGLVTGHFSPETGEGVLRVLWHLTKVELTRVFEQLIYQAFYSARRKLEYDAVLVHSSGVIHDGAGFLFVGESGTGKSTVAELSSDFDVLNDEICLVEFTPDGPVLHSTPFNGYFEGKVEGHAPLRAICLLAHGREHALEDIGPAASVSILTGQIVAPLGLEEALSPQTSHTMLNMAGRLYGVPTRRLYFTPDAAFWRVLDREFSPEER